ncbi:MAG: hypothetical protein GXY83_23640 [Rhodopirellula sp.]|nr:hypothetical protein [Rhodopirellula sp.]
MNAILVLSLMLATAELNRKLPEDLVAQAEERLSIESDGDLMTRTVAADVMVYQPQGSDVEEGGLAISAPYKLVVGSELVLPHPALGQGITRSLAQVDA